MTQKSRSQDPEMGEETTTKAKAVEGGIIALATTRCSTY